MSTKACLIFLSILFVLKFLYIIFATLLGKHWISVQVFDDFSVQYRNCLRPPFGLPSLSGRYTGRRAKVVRLTCSLRTVTTSVSVDVPSLPSPTLFRQPPSPLGLRRSCLSLRLIPLLLESRTPTRVRSETVIAPILLHVVLHGYPRPQPLVTGSTASTSVTRDPEVSRRRRAPGILRGHTRNGTRSALEGTRTQTL